MEFGTYFGTEAEGVHRRISAETLLLKISQCTDELISVQTLHLSTLLKSDR